jgi:hypothetical protein
MKLPRKNGPMLLATPVTCRCDCGTTNFSLSLIHDKLKPVAH